MDLIAELKAAKGRSSLKKVRKNEDDDTVSEQSYSSIAENNAADGDDPKIFWQGLQRRKMSPPSREGSLPRVRYL